MPNRDLHGRRRRGPARHGLWGHDRHRLSVPAPGVVASAQSDARTPLVTVAAGGVVPSATGGRVISLPAPVATVQRYAGYDVGRARQSAGNARCVYQWA